jgi:hypothetical protein
MSETPLVGPHIPRHAAPPGASPEASMLDPLVTGIGDVAQRVESVDQGIAGLGQRVDNLGHITAQGFGDVQTQLANNDYTAEQRHQDVTTQGAQQHFNVMGGLGNINSTLHTGFMTTANTTAAVVGAVNTLTTALTPRPMPARIIPTYDAVGPTVGVDLPSKNFPSVVDYAAASDAARNQAKWWEGKRPNTPAPGTDRLEAARHTVQTGQEMQRQAGNRLGPLLGGMAMEAAGGVRVDKAHFENAGPALVRRTPNILRNPRQPRTVRLAKAAGAVVLGSALTVAGAPSRAAGRVASWLSGSNHQSSLGATPRNNENLVR